MLFEESCNRDSVSELEERSLLQQIVSFGVGYPYGRSGLSKAAISETVSETGMMGITFLI